MFVKGLPSGHRRVITQAREAAAAPFVSEISPAVLWHFDEAGWNVLGYRYAPGRHADYTPGSSDLDRLVQLMHTLGAIKVPGNPGFRLSPQQTLRTLTCSLRPTSGSGHRSRGPARALGQRSWRKPRTCGPPTARYK